MEKDVVEDGNSLSEMGTDKEKEDAHSVGKKKTKKFPKSIFFIVGNEFCERFSYYGMRAVLTLYFTTVLGMSDRIATIIYHTFVMFCYFTPIFGAWLADSWLGKFRTIFYVSIIYALGNIVLSLSATPPTHIPMMPFSMVGLALIAIGTGGIKPCVSAFGGDQFDLDQVRLRERFFFIFYFSINAGSLISTFVTPILRGDVHCFGDDSCFPLAFGVPAILMIIAIVLFVSGKFMYRMVPPQGNIVGQVISCIWHALRRRHSSKEKKSNWLDYADDKYDTKFIGDVRAALRVMYLYIPLPIFWALFEQQGSTWTIQATEMNGRLTSNYVILPDQMQVVNPLLILLLIPVFESGVYPLLARCNVLTGHLSRMFTGGMLAGVAFFIAGFVQLAIEKNLPVFPSAGTADVTYINSMNCSIQLSRPMLNDVTVTSLGTFTDKGIRVDVDGFPFPMNVTTNCDGVNVTMAQFDVTLDSATAYTMVFNTYNGDMHMTPLIQSRRKPEDGNGQVRLACSLETFAPGSNVVLENKHDTYYFQPIDNTSDHVFDSDFQSVIPAYYDLCLPYDQLINKSSMKIPDVSLDIESGAVYTVAIQADASLSQVNVVSYAEVKANQIQMLWQVPQYVVITVGEIMFSITGLAFSYSQAPASMKSVLQAAWLITDAVGNIIIIILESIPMFKDQSSMFFLYASILVVVMSLFAWMCYGYQYVTIDSEGNVCYPDDSLKSSSNSRKRSKSDESRHSDDTTTGF